MNKYKVCAQEAKMREVSEDDARVRCHCQTCTQVDCRAASMTGGGTHVPRPRPPSPSVELVPRKPRPSINDFEQCIFCMKELKSPQTKAQHKAKPVGHGGWLITATASSLKAIHLSNNINDDPPESCCDGPIPGLSFATRPLCGSHKRI
jgi:hypothetical protein